MAHQGNTNRAILTPSEVLSIRQATAGRNEMRRRIKELRHEIKQLTQALEKINNPALAKQYKVSRWTIASVTCGKNWRGL